MPELTDDQKVLRNDTGKRIAAALEALAGTGGRGLPAGGTDGDVLVKNGATDYDAKWTSTPPQMGSLATIETSPITNPNGYNKGDYLVYNGQLYYVKTLISPQGSLDPSENGNIRAVTVGSELPKPSIGTPFVIANSNISSLERGGVRRYGHVVVLDIAFTVSATISDYTATLFSGIPPSFTYNQRFCLFSVDNTKELVLAVTTSGTIINQWTQGNITPNTYQGQCVYIAN